MRLKDRNHCHSDGVEEIIEVQDQVDIFPGVKVPRKMSVVNTMLVIAHLDQAVSLITDVPFAINMDMAHITVGRPMLSVTTPGVTTKIVMNGTRIDMTGIIIILGGNMEAGKAVEVTGRGKEDE